MKLKRVLCIALALTLALAIFAGCSNDDKQTTAAPNGTALPDNRVVDTSKPVNTPSNSSNSDYRKITPGPSDSAEASQTPAESETPEATLSATDDGSGN